MNIPGALVYEILYQDESILAVNKPAGLLTLPDGYHPELPYLGRLLEKDFGRIWVVHRLDRDTSGVILFALTAIAHRSLNTQFEERATRKTYHALVVGNPSWETTNTDAPLRVDGDRKHRTVIDVERGKPAATELAVFDRFGSTALIEAHPLSGYTHQIRAHMAHLGFPILNDLLYGKDQNSQISFAPVIKRLALHAVSIQFTHPTTGKPFTLKAPYPLDFDEQLAQLRGGKRI